MLPKLCPKLPRVVKMVWRLRSWQQASNVHPPFHLQTYSLVLAETLNHPDADTGPIIDNNINMDFSITGLVAQPQPSPDAARDDLPPIPPTPPAPPAQPTPLDIIQSIKALGNKFDILLRTGECVNVVEA
jgi:hypothetical protein